MAAAIIARNKAGQNLWLIGGFRYRLLDESVRRSIDIDYHYEGDLEAKQLELRNLCERTLLPKVQRDLGYEGMARNASGPAADSPNARFIDLSFWKTTVPSSRVEIPIEITTVARADRGKIVTAGGVIYPALSDADQIESKLIAVVNRTFLQHRDLVDLFLFQDRVLPETPARLQQKLHSLRLSPETIKRRVQDLQTHVDYHAGAIQKVLDEQVEPLAVEQIKMAGGGGFVLQEALKILERNLPL